MPSQYTQRHFEKNGYYHVYNRGAHKREIFFGRNDYQTFIDILFYYLTYPNGKPYSEFNNNQEKISLILGAVNRSAGRLLNSFCDSFRLASILDLSLFSHTKSSAG